MTTTVTGAVAVRQKQDQVVAWIRAQQDDIAMIAASHVRPAAIVRVTQGALRRNDKLMAAAIANPQSLLYALLDAARLGHEPDTDDYYLVPFGNEVTGIEGYKGIIERMYRAGGVETVVAEVVRQADAYQAHGSTTPPLHEYDDFASPQDRGPLRGAYAYALWPGGRCSQVIRMGRAEIMEHKAKSRGSDRPDSPWQQWEPAMWKKTVLRALEPYVPTSTEYRHAPVQGSVTEALRLERAAHDARPAAPAADVVDGELVEDEPGHPAPSATAPADQAPPRTAGKTALASLADQLTRLPLGDEEDTASLIQWLTRRQGDVTLLTASEARIVSTFLASELEAAQGDVSAAASAIWVKFRNMNPEQESPGE